MCVNLREGRSREGGGGGRKKWSERREREGRVGTWRRLESSESVLLCGYLS